MELELKHIAPYLPYGLKCTNTKKSYNQTGEDKTGILETLSVNTDDSVIMGAEGYFLVGYHEILPLLRPMSSLTEVIEVDGRSFIPIIDLARLENGGGIFDYQIEKLFILDFGGSIGLYYTSSAGLVEFSYDPLLMTFTMMLRHKDESYKCDLIVNHQLKMFQKLFEWHFDVFGLIGKGLAINMEEL